MYVYIYTHLKMYSINISLAREYTCNLMDVDDDLVLYLEKMT